jgi:hypothetical protein
MSVMHSDQRRLSMRMFIPPLKTKLEVLKTWTVHLYSEYRNRSLWAHLEGVDETVYHDHMLEHCRTLVKTVKILSGSRLSVSRVHIRKGQEMYNSVTLHGTVYLDPDVPITCRFWVCLDDWNTLNAQVIT